MKKQYAAPTIKANEYAQFENVYTAGCSKNYDPAHGWKMCPHGDEMCYYSASFDTIGPHRSSHTNISGS